MVRDQDQEERQGVCHAVVEWMEAMDTTGCAQSLIRLFTRFCAVGDGVCGRGSFLAHIDGYEDLSDPIVRYVLNELLPSPTGFFRPA